MNITLEPVTRANFEAVMDIELPPGQAHYVASNAYSIAQAHYYPELQPCAICEGGKPVGFLLFGLPEQGAPGHYGIYRLMVDPALQKRGIGRRAMELLLEDLRARPDARRIWICYKPDNAVGQRFYASLGFRETGLDDEGR
ncbi:GNAT family N-acetyltransferase [Massilia sp. METH4]|uniref:GNAT family N-acetyltransferase n=1 Tax=Massilia sp. METH4 TaxID=3123041 RepID=UPI0030CBB254